MINIKKYLRVLLSKCGLALKRDLDLWKTNFVPPGHYYSPYVNKKDLANSISNYRKDDYNLLGIDLNNDLQLELLNDIVKFYDEKSIPITKSSNFNYYFDNQYFSYSDAIILKSLILKFKPKKIIEIGSGFSSALMIDINKQFFNNSIHLNFIEPFPENRLNNLINKDDSCHVIKDFVQKIDLDIYSTLEKNDILFVDSSHVSKALSDVNHIIFNILPILKPGVIIHFHDIFYPFEYPQEWILSDRAWNEAYLLRAFLQFNDKFEILLFSSYLENQYRSWFETNMPFCLKKHEYWIDENGRSYLLNTGGQSIYLRRMDV